ncbi:Trans-aconitate 2-methyltransferase [Pleomorphomonas sp. T1.2MG-36]|uniref:class I SAM-dependent methyltransferase n=1 Tax=Pleomorphomonas sp. T1.2MG-36 TaxID=3041167 RepID=UPI0024772FEF|nr:class I SAM-dependent methyltransferase [Pleomorphomonas sp. T1.2MG-36]CAI9417543.1 Trans-aconitate 2-methyltransferase [Pleomorphomonas sp. T1.2MG-36]
MAQNIYDNPEFFSGYTQYPRQVIGLDGATEWPAVRAMLPPIQGKRVADLGCGFGWASRWMRSQGAASVQGFDLSEKMIARAHEDTDDPAIDYRIADLETLELPEAAFDLVYSSLAFHYVKDIRRLMRTIHDALVPNGDLVFTTEHPIYMAPAHPRWLVDEDGRKIWPVNSYSIEGERRTEWFVKDVLKYHRTMATTLNTLIEEGFTLRRLREFGPTPEEVSRSPDLSEEEVERPMMLLVAVHRP